MKKLTTIFVAAIFLYSCNPVKKAVNTFDKYPNAAALYCSIKFPAKDSTIKGDTVTKTDTIVNVITDSVSVDCPPDQPKIITITKACPPGKTITVTKVVTDTIIRRDIAKETVLSNSLTESQTTVTKLQGKYEGMKDKRDRWRLWFWILLGAAGAYTALKIKRIIPF